MEYLNFIVKVPTSGWFNPKEIEDFIRKAISQPDNKINLCHNATVRPFNPHTEH